MGEKVEGQGLLEIADALIVENKLLLKEDWRFIQQVDKEFLQEFGMSLN